ncbi:hypothetical protein Vretifemale_13638, partial [Volvox reticuliferus]
NGSRGDESSGQSRSSLRTSSVAAAAAAAEGRSNLRPVSQSTLTESTGRPRRPSSPTSEAPSVDERRPESTTLLVHPILPQPAPPPPPGPGPSILNVSNSEDEGDSAGPPAAAHEFGRGFSIIGQESGRTRTSSEAADAELARASTEGMPPTPPTQQPGQQSRAFASLALPTAQLTGAAPAEYRQAPSRPSGSTGVRVSSGAPDPDIDYSIARVGGAAMPGTGGAKASGAASRTADGRPARNKGTERANPHHVPRVSGGGGGVRK